jgi:DNA-binding beta-propeller fold protein YncE
MSVPPSGRGGGPRLRRALAAATLLSLVTTACGSGGGERVEAVPSSTTSAPATSTTAPSTTTTAPGVATVPGMPPVVDPANIYSEAAVGKLSAATNGARFLVYVPNEATSTLTVIDPRTYSVVATWPMRQLPQHVVPAYDMTRLYVLNNAADALTPIDPLTGEPGRPIAVADPYNLYFTPDGREAIIVEEANRKLTFTDPVTFQKHSETALGCDGFNHLDFSIDGRYLVGSCEFDGNLVKVDTQTREVVGRLHLDIGASGKANPIKGIAQPQDVRLSNDGKVFYVADLITDGVYLIDGESFTQIGFLPTGVGAHGLYPSRDGRQLYVVNRGTSSIPPVGSFKGKGKGGISVIDFASRTVVAQWGMDGGGSPDMGALTADGTELWLGGRYDAEVYVFDTRAGTLTHRIPAGQNPHGLTVWPQPGRFSFGHTGNVR